MDSLEMDLTLTTDAMTEDANTSSASASYNELPTDWYKEHINGYYKNNLSIGHLNINSILGKIEDVLNLLNECRFDLLFISETKIDKSVSSSLLSTPHYRIIRRDRKQGAGDLLVYIRNTVIARRQVKMEPENIESICLSFKGNANTWFYVCACYRSPNKCKVTDFISACTVAADKMLKSKREIVFLGDMNIDMLQTTRNMNLHIDANPLADFCNQFCLTNTIPEPTRVTKRSETLIDVILVNRPERWATSGTLQIGLSDHDLVYIVRKQRLPKFKTKVIKSRSMKNFNLDTFLADAASTPWDTAFVYDDLDDIWAHWSKLYDDTIEKYAPMIKNCTDQPSSLDKYPNQRSYAIEKQVVRKIPSLSY